MSDEPLSGGTVESDRRWGVVRTVGTMVGVALVVVAGSVALRPDPEAIAAAAEGRPPGIERAVPVPAEPPPPGLVVPAEPEIEVEIETLTPVPGEDDGRTGL
ncbi:MAG: hypothetical protein R3320_13065, partial [Nitriliruptorales bacterium]|nr:hypothetical protein [Nitriliruptorales bacterium]